MITVNCQSSIKITGKKVIYFDPLKLESKEKDADFIFITHTHWDHFSKDDILKIKNEGTKIIGPRDILEDCLKLGFKENNIITVVPNERKIIENISFKTVPAYNKIKNFHPKQNNWVGYVITINQVTYYIMGDTDALEENQNINCNIVFSPIGGKYTMDSKEAAQFINILNPKKVIPIHYGLIVGTKNDLEEFKKLVNDSIEVEEKIIF